MVPRPERYCVDIPVDCASRDAFTSNTITNLSRGGLFMESADPLPLQSDVDLTIRLQCPDVTIRATGRVIWNYDIRKGTSRIIPGNGIKIVAMSPEHRALLDACLQQLAKSQAAAAAER